jgi:hypothetical protein
MSLQAVCSSGACAEERQCQFFHAALQPARRYADVGRGPRRNSCRPEGERSCAGASVAAALGDTQGAMLIAGVMATASHASALSGAGSRSLCMPYQPLSATFRKSNSSPLRTSGGMAE